MIRRGLDQDLRTIQADINESGSYSDFINIFDIKDTYAKGIHTITMRGSDELQKGTYIYVEIVDEAGRPIPIQVAPSSEVYEQEFLPLRRFSFEVTDETLNGVATITFVATLDDGRVIKYERKFSINKSLPSKPVIYRGDWAEGEFYDTNEVVGYNGSSYISILSHKSIENADPTIDNSPPDSTYWRVFADRGNDGLGVQLSISSSNGVFFKNGTVSTTLSGNLILNGVSVVADGYQWIKNGTPISGETGSTLSVSETTSYVKYELEVTHDNKTYKSEIDLYGYEDGVDAQLIKITSDSQIIEQLSDGSYVNDTITLNVLKQNYTGGVEWFKNGSFTTPFKTTDQITVGVSDFDGSKKLSLEVRDDVDGSLRDEISLFVVREGSDAITIVVENENHTFGANRFGVVSGADYADGATDVKVYLGNTLLTYNNTVGATTTDLVVGEYLVSISSNTDIVGTLSKDVDGNAVITPSEFTDAKDKALINFTVDVRTSDTDIRTFTKQLSYSKSLAPENAKFITLLTNDGQIFEEDQDGQVTTPRTDNKLTFSVEKSTTDITGDPIWKLDGVDITPTTDKYNITLSASDILSGVKVLSVEIGSFIDKVSVARLKEGKDTFTILLSNEFHGLPSDRDGTVSSVAGAETSINIYRGITDVTGNFTYDETGVTGVTYDKPTSTNGYTLTVNTVTNDVTSIAITATPKSSFAGYYPSSLTKTFTLTKVKQGELGLRGLSLLYKGSYKSGVTYSRTDVSTDVVIGSDGVYYYVPEGVTSIINDDPTGTTTDWVQFEAQFESVATDLLLAKDVTIRRSLTMGQATDNSGGTAESGGIIQSLGGYKTDGTATVDPSLINRRFYKLDKDGIDAWKGTIGGWDIEEGILKSVVDSSGIVLDSEQRSIRMLSKDRTNDPLTMAEGATIPTTVPQIGTTVNGVDISTYTGGGTVSSDPFAINTPNEGVEVGFDFSAGTNGGVIDSKSCALQGRTSPTASWETLSEINFGQSQRNYISANAGNYTEGRLLFTFEVSGTPSGTTVTIDITTIRSKQYETVTVLNRNGLTIRNSPHSVLRFGGGSATVEFQQSTTETVSWNNVLGKPFVMLGKGLGTTNSALHLDFTEFSTNDIPEGDGTTPNLYYTNERVDDRVSSIIKNGTGISWVYDDLANTLTPAISLSPFSTADLSEDTNLYHTVQRVKDIVRGTGVFQTLSTTDNVTFNNATFNGNVIIQGDTIQVDSQITTSDAVIDVNDGEAGAGVTLGFGGLNIDRGTENDYWFGFDEVRNRFTVGQITGLNATQIATTQVVATREDTPTANGVAFWDDTNTRFSTHLGITYDGANLVQSSGYYWNKNNVSYLSGGAVVGSSAVPTYDFEVDGNSHFKTGWLWVEDSYIQASNRISVGDFNELPPAPFGGGRIGNSALQVSGSIDVTGSIGFISDATTQSSSWRMFQGGDIPLLILKNYNSSYAVADIKGKGTDPADQTKNSESTLALFRGTSDELNSEFLDLFNNGYWNQGVALDPSVYMGIRVQKRGTGVYRPFKMQYSDGTEILDVWENSVDKFLLHVDTDIDGVFGLKDSVSGEVSWDISSSVKETGAPAFLFLKQKLSEIAILEVVGKQADPTSTTVDGESTLTLMREGGGGAEFLDLYNNGYNDSKEYGLQIQSRGIGELRPFNFQFFDGTNRTTAFSISAPDASQGTTLDISSLVTMNTGLELYAYMYSSDAIYVDLGIENYGYLSNTGSATFLDTVDISNKLTVSSTSLFTGDSEYSTQISSTDGFKSGFGGHGVKIDFLNDDIHTTDLTVRGRMSVYELLIKQIRATNGSLWVSSSMKAEKVTTVTAGRTYNLHAKDDQFVTFTEGSVIRAQRFDGKGTYIVNGVVTNVVNGDSDVSVNTPDDRYATVDLFEENLVDERDPQRAEPLNISTSGTATGSADAGYVGSDKVIKYTNITVDASYPRSQLSYNGSFDFPVLPIGSTGYYGFWARHNGTSGSILFSWQLDGSTKGSTAHILTSSWQYFSGSFSNGSFNINRYYFRPQVDCEVKGLTISHELSPDVPLADMDFVRIGHAFNSDEMGNVYLSADDSGAPFMDIIDEVVSNSDFQSAKTHKSRFGNLEGIVDPTFGQLEGYGSYIQNLYATGNAQIAGTLTAGDENGVGNTFYAGKIKKNIMSITSGTSDIPLGFTNYDGGGNPQKPQSTDTTLITPNGTTGCRFFEGSSSTTYGNYHIYDTINVEEGKIYTFSFWVRTGVGQGECDITVQLTTDVNSNPTERNWIIGEEWTRVYVTKDYTGATIGTPRAFIAENPSQGEDLYVYGVQLEEVDSINATPSTYQKSDGTISSDNGYGMWANRGGFGGTIQNPILNLTDQGIDYNEKIFIGENRFADFNDAIHIYNVDENGRPRIWVKHDSNNYVGIFWDDINNWGIKGMSGDPANPEFELGSTNQIAGWTFTDKSLYKKFSTNVYMALGEADQLPTGWGDATAIRGLTIGKDVQNRIWFGEINDDYEIQAIIGNNVQFQLGSRGNQIAGWGFTNTQFSSKNNNIVLNSNDDGRINVGTDFWDGDTSFMFGGTKGITYGGGATDKIIFGSDSVFNGTVQIGGVDTHAIYAVGHGNDQVGQLQEQLKINGETIYTSHGRGLKLTIYDKNLNLRHSAVYDVYFDDIPRNALADVLTGVTTLTEGGTVNPSDLIVLTSQDAQQAGSNSAMMNAIDAIGGDYTGFQNYLNTTSNNYRTPYALIGQLGLGRGGGFEAWTRSGDANAPSAVVQAYYSNGYIYGTKTGFGTRITGDQIQTGVIKSNNYTAPTTSSSPFSVDGTQFNLDTGELLSKNFVIDSNGSLELKGTVIADSGFIGGWEITNDYLKSEVTGVGRITLDPSEAINASTNVPSFRMGAYFSGIVGDNGIYEILNISPQGVAPPVKKYNEGVVTLANYNIDCNGSFTVISEGIPKTFADSLPITESGSYLSWNYKIGLASADTQYIKQIKVYILGNSTSGTSPKIIQTIIYDNPSSDITDVISGFSSYRDNHRLYIEITKTAYGAPAGTVSFYDFTWEETNTTILINEKGIFRRIGTNVVESIGGGGEVNTTVSSVNGYTGDVTLDVSDISGAVPDTGGTFSGTVWIKTASDGKLNLQSTNDGTVSGTAEGGWNYINFFDAQQDRQGYIGIDANGNMVLTPLISGKTVQANGGTVWSGGNDGAGSGLDADLLDGNHASAFATGDNFSTTGNYAGLTAGDLDNGTTGNLNSTPTTDSTLVYQRYSSSASNKPYGGGNNANGVLTMMSHSGIYGKQISFRDDDDLYMRKFTNGTFGTWRELYHTGNLSAGDIGLGSNDNVTFGSGTFSGTLGVYGNYINFISGTDARIQVTDSNPYTTGAQFIFWGDGVSHNATLEAEVFRSTNDIYVANQIIHDGDTDTYMQFHAVDQWRVVTGGSERLEVNNSAVKVNNSLTVSGGIDTDDIVTDRAYYNNRGSVYGITKRFRWGGGTDTSWKRVAILKHNDSGGSYKGINGEISIWNLNGNHGNSIPDKFEARFRFLALGGSNGLVDDIDFEVTEGAGNLIRIVKNGVNDYELQVRSPSNYRRMQAEVSFYDIQTNASVIHSDLQTPSTSTTVISPTASHISKFGQVDISSLRVGTTEVITSGRDLVNINNITVANDIDLARTSVITFYGDSNHYHSISSRGKSFENTDDLRINSYGAVYVNLDSNSNNGTGTANFEIGYRGGVGAINTTYFTVESGTGDVGIGTTTPITKVDIDQGAVGGSNSTSLTLSGSPSTGGGNAIFLKTSGNTTLDRYGAKIGAIRNANNNGSADLIIDLENSTATGLVSRFKVEGDTGNVGIGTSSPTEKLVVNGDAHPSIELRNTNYSNGGFIINRTNYNDKWKWWAQSNVMYFTHDDGTGYSNLLHLTSSGRLGIGTSPSAKLDVQGAIKYGNNGFDNYEVIVNSTSSAIVNFAGTAISSSSLGDATYRVRLATKATGTDTGYSAILWRLSGTWYLHEEGYAGKNSNHPIVEIESNIPIIRHTHTNNYPVAVSIERIETDDDAQPHIWGASSLLTRDGSSLLVKSSKLEITTPSHNKLYLQSTSGAGYRAELKVNYDYNNPFQLTGYAGTDIIRQEKGNTYLMFPTGNVAIGSITRTAHQLLVSGTGKFTGSVTVNSLVSNGSISGTSGTFSGQITAGSGGNNKVLTRHVDGKDGSTDAYSTLYLNYYSGSSTVIGNGGGNTYVKNNLYAQGALYLSGNLYSNGDTNTYMQFHASDQWRVVTGGSQRLEVNNSAVTTSVDLNANADHNQFRRGINGGYSGTAGSGSGDWGNNIWSIGSSWDGNGYGTGFSLGTGQYGLVWLRDLHASADSQANEGLYLYRGSNTPFAIFGHNSAKFNTHVRLTGTYNVYANDFHLSSDRRLKSDIEDLYSIDLLRKLQPKSFYKNDVFGYGFIAQDIQELAPSMVGDSGEYLSLRQTDIIALNTSAIQYLDTKLEDETTKLKRRVDELEEKVRQLGGSV